MILKKILSAEIRNWKKTREWSSVLYNYLLEIIEVNISNYGNDLDREETIQNLWIFVIKLLPKVNTRKNCYSYLHSCIKHFISDLREREERHTHIDIDKYPQLEAKNEYPEWN